MKTVKFIVPEGASNEGEVIEVPESDAESFEANGWEREGSSKSSNKGSNKNKNS